MYSDIIFSARASDNLVCGKCWRVTIFSKTLDRKMRFEIGQKFDISDSLKPICLSLDLTMPIFALENWR